MFLCYGIVAYVVYYYIKQLLLVMHSFKIEIFELYNIT